MHTHTHTKDNNLVLYGLSGRRCAHVFVCFCCWWRSASSSSSHARVCGRVLAEKVGVKLGERGDDVLEHRLWREDRGAEVERAVALSKPGAGHRAYPRLVQQLQAVVLIGRVAEPFRGVDSARRQLNLRERVHRALHRAARHAFQRIERRREHLRAAAQRADDAARLLLVQFVARLAHLGRVHHKPDVDLPVHVGRQIHAQQLVHLRFGAGVDINRFKIRASSAALAKRAF
mmetsp:Transcript_17081/g.37145  ORF Transcript_17081/g.37145 Transcript_17081/m.37145 type:complete len:231 (+) Transcript_17081:580-1272(+)